MKRVLSLILAAGLLLSFSGIATAFDDNDLVAIIYNENDNEAVVKLGDLADINFTATNQDLSSSFDLQAGSLFGAGISLTDLNLAYFGGTQAGGSWNVWFATTKPTISGISSAKLQNFLSGVTSVYDYWGAGNTTFNGPSSATNSYDNKLNSGSNAPGSYAGVNNTDTAFGEANLSALEGADGYVDMYLYHYVYATLDKGPDDTTDYTAVLRLYLDGSLVLNPTDNNAPTISGTPGTSVVEGTAYSFTPVANDADGDALTFSITNKPSWAAFDTATGALTGTPANTDVGTTSGIVISVSDGIASASLASFNLQVTAVVVNNAPTISGTPDTNVSAGTAYSFTPVASDADGDTLTFNIINMPSWAAFSTTTGALTGTPADTDVGTTTGIVISVTDGTDSVSLASFDLEVTAAATNNAPVISGSPDTSVEEGSDYSFTPTASDADSDTLTFSITNKPSWASFSTTTGAFTGTPASTDVGTTTGIVISVTDGTDTASLASFDLEVTAKATNDDDNCFISTVAFGSFMESSHISNYTAQHNTLRAFCLAPLTGLASAASNVGPVNSTLLVLALLCGIILGYKGTRRKGTKGNSCIN